MSDIAIKVENVSKRYVIGEKASYLTLRDKLMELPLRLFKGPKRTKEFWALKDVSFEVKKGEVVGIIGRNGAGKSTMLKILARITEPTSGRITMHGRVASMLEVGTGFNPELTGRENIYLNGAIIGMQKKEIEAKFKDIVEFSGVDKFLDTPVKHYSSGMYVRLAFAVAAHLDADILLVDEVLAVGDAEFQKKCLGKMSDLAGGGKTVIFVSHNIAAINSLSSKIVYLDNGNIITAGNSHEVIKKYLKTSNTDLNKIYISQNMKLISQINTVYLADTENQQVEYNKPIKIIVTYRNSTKNRLYLAFSIHDQYGSMLLFRRDFELVGNKIIDKHPGQYKCRITIPANSFVPGSYYIKTGISNYDKRTLIHETEQPLWFDVIDTTSSRSKSVLSWRGIMACKIDYQEQLEKIL